MALDCNIFSVFLYHHKSHGVESLFPSVVSSFYSFLNIHFLEWKAENVFLGHKKFSVIPWKLFHPFIWFVQLFTEMVCDVMCAGNRKSKRNDFSFWEKRNAKGKFVMWTTTTTATTLGKKISNFSTPLSSLVSRIHTLCLKRAKFLHGNSVRFAHHV